MIGRTIGRFRIVAPLGQGGMASVWHAHDELLGRELALKILSETVAQSEDARRRFRHEALIAAQLDHPGIAAVYDSGETDGHTWIAMALIDGETLAERMTRSLIPIPQVVSTAIVVADALGYAHARGVVHRDVTSRNVMLGSDGRVFVLDFGLALAQGTSRVSSSGTTVGTAPYMAPELLTGATANARSDVYGLGIVVYEALTGVLPFASEQPAAALFDRLNRDARPPRLLRPEIPESLERIVMRSLLREPAGRYANAAELAAGLRAAEAEMRGAPAATAAVDARPPAAGTAARSASAERLADRSGPVYVAIPPFEVLDHDDGAPRVSLDLARNLAIAAAAGLGRLQRVHVVPCDAPPPGRAPDALRAYARSLGVNLLILGGVRTSATRLRVTYAVSDPEANLQIAGDALEGSTLDTFELEDRLIASLRTALARERGPAPAMRERPRDPAATEHLQQALRYMERHDQESSVDAAIGLLEGLIESDGETAVIQAALTRALLFKYELTRQRTWETRAAAAAARAAELAPAAPETLLALGEVHRVGGRFSEAEREYSQALAQRPGYYEALLGRARVLDDLGHTTEAVASLERLIEANPVDWRAHNFLGRLHFNQGDYARALAPWTRVAEMVTDNARAASNLGSTLYRLDRFEDALAAYRKSIEIQPNAMGFTNLGTTLFILHRFEEAADACEKAVALTPSDPIAWGNLGNALRQLPSRRERCREALDRAAGLAMERLERSPADAELWARLAGWLANLDRPEGARRALGEALRRGPGHGACLVRAAHVHLQLEERDEAAQRLVEAVAAGWGIGEIDRDPELMELKNHPTFQRLSRSAPRSSGPRH